MAIGIDDVDMYDDLLSDDGAQEVNELDPAQAFRNQQTTVRDEDDDEDTDVQSGTAAVQETDHEYENSDESEEVDIIQTLLRQRGIEDPSKINFQNEDGEIEERDWADLSVDEQLNILSGEREPVDTSDTDLDDDEIDLINRLRLSNMSPQEYLDLVGQQAVAKYANQLQQEQGPLYTVDSLTDDELFVLDLQARVEDITDEELKDALDRAKENEDLFAKQMKGIREEYKQLEDDKNQRDAALLQQQQQEQFNQFAQSIAGSIQSFSNIGDLDINMTNEDMNNLYGYIVGQNASGINQFSQDLNDPDKLIRMAWFGLNGENVINSISQYYKEQITQAHRAGVKEGMEKAEKKASKSNKVVVKAKPDAKQVKKYTSIDDLDW